MISNNGMISMKYIKKYVPRNGQNFIEIWYFVTKIVLTSVRKNCSSDREKLLNIKAEGQEFAKCLIFFSHSRSEQFW